MAKRFTAKKWNGDDQYSWAVFDGQRVDGFPVMAGCSREEARAYVRQYEKDAQGKSVAEAELVYIATYGTLRTGYSNWNQVLQRQKSLGTFKTQGFHMYTNGGYPYAIPTRSKDTIVVELFKITHETFLKCDRLEGYPNHYDRRRIELIGSDIRPWMYFVPRRKATRIIEHYPQIKSGDWSDNKKIYK